MSPRVYTRDPKNPRLCLPGCTCKRHGKSRGTGVYLGHPDATCSVIEFGEPCGLSAHWREGGRDGLCSKHTQRLDAHGTTDPVKGAHINHGKTCIVEGCVKDACWKRMCDTHANSMHNRGTVEESEWHRTRRGVPKDPCSVPGCPNLRTGRQEICKPHQTRLRKTGDVGVDKPWRHTTGESNETCIVPNEDGSLCGKPARTHPMAERNNPDWKWGRLCIGHYGRYCKHGCVQQGKKMRDTYGSHLPLSERVPFWLDPDNGFVARVDGCLQWQRVLSANGAGYPCAPVSKIDDTTRTSPWLVHRLVWEHFNGPIPVGNHVHHICGTPNCVDIDHLECIGYIENGSEACRIKQFRDKANEPGMTIEALRAWMAR